MPKMAENENNQRSKNTNTIHQPSDHQTVPQFTEKTNSPKQSKSQETEHVTLHQNTIAINHTT